MNTISLPHRRESIDLSAETLRALSGMAKAQGTNLKNLIESTLDKIAEDYNDHKDYAWFLEHAPEGQEMVSEEEKAEFEKWLGV